jgi:PAS domain S-box-containing protein
MPGINDGKDQALRDEIASLKRENDRLGRENARLKIAAEELKALSAAGRRDRDKLILFEKFLDASSQALGTGSLEGRVTYANPALLRIMGFKKAEEAIGRPLTDFYREEDQAALVDEILPEVVAKGMKTMDMPLVSVHGELTPTNQAVFLIRDDEGAPLCFANVITDMTLHKEIEDALRRARDELELRVEERTAELSEEVEQRRRAEAALARLAAVMNMTTDFVATAEPDGRASYINQAGQRMTGLEEGCDYTKLKITNFHPDWAAKKVLEEGIPEAIAHGTWSGETALLGPDEQPFPTSQVLISHKSATGELEYLSTIIRDISDQKAQERRLREREEDLNITLNSIGDAVIATDADGRVTRLNPVAERLTGWSLRDAVGRRLGEVFETKSADTGEPLESPASGILNTGVIQGQTEHIILKARDNTERLVSDSGAPIRNADGEVCGIVLVFRDVTEKHRMEEQLRQSQKMDAIGKLAGGVAHDFNNMLAGILGFAEILADELEDRQHLRGYVDRIVSAAERSAALTRKLLSFSRKSDLQSRRMDLHRTISDTIAILVHSIDKRVTLEKRLGAKSSTVMGDPTQLQGLFLNLGLNAKDAMVHGGTLLIETENRTLDRGYCEDSPFNLEPGEYIRVSVKDSGVGMSADTLEHIFEPFYTTKEVGKGTGLGLSTAYSVVKEHRGAIHVSSTLNEGSTFTVLLKLEESSTSVQPGSEPMVAGGGETILVVDDEPLLRDSAESMLTNMGYRVILAEDGFDAIQRYKKHRGEIKLVILDLVMPKLDGADAFYQLKKLDEHVRVILCSGFTKETRIDILLRDGAHSFLQKPFRQHQLAEAVAQALKGS